MAALLWALERRSCAVRSRQAAPADLLLLLRGRQQVAGARVVLRCRGRSPRAVNNFHSAIQCGWHFSKPRRGAIWCHSDTTQICVTPQKCFWHQLAMGCLVSTLLSCSVGFGGSCRFMRSAMIPSSTPHPAPLPGTLSGESMGAMAVHNGATRGAICAGDWLACGTPYVAQSCAAHGCFSLVRQGRPTPQRPGDIVRITRRAVRANSAKGTAA